MAFVCGVADAATITGWNTANVAVSTTTAGVEGESVIYDRAPTAVGAQTGGKVIFDGDEADKPGLRTFTGLCVTGSCESSGAGGRAVASWRAAASSAMAGSRAASDSRT